MNGLCKSRKSNERSGIKPIVGRLFRCHTTLARKPQKPRAPPDTDMMHKYSGVPARPVMCAPGFNDLYFLISKMPFRQGDLDIFERTSRISSGFSLAGASFIILTFCTSKKFHRPINRLAFYASFGNIVTNLATIYSREGIRQGKESRMCQAQAAILQWAIPADALFVHP